MEKIIVNVTQEDIDSGSQDSGNGCAIALALKKILGQHHNIHVGNKGSLRINGSTYALPFVAHDFIQKFDMNKSLVSPFSFEIYRVSEYYPNASFYQPEYISKINIEFKSMNTPVEGITYKSMEMF